MEDWEVGRVALSCHLLMDLLCQEHEGCVLGELRVAGFPSFTRAVDVSPNEMEVEVERGSRVSGRLRQVNPKDREKWPCLLTVVRRKLHEECHQCLRSRYKQSKMSTMPQAMQLTVRGVSVSPHVSVPEGALPGVGVDSAYMGPSIQVSSLT